MTVLVWSELVEWLAEDGSRSHRLKELIRFVSLWDPEGYRSLLSVKNLGDSLHVGGLGSLKAIW